MDNAPDYNPTRIANFLSEKLPSGSSVIFGDFEKSILWSICNYLSERVPILGLVLFPEFPSLQGRFPLFLNEEGLSGRETETPIGYITVSRFEDSSDERGEQSFENTTLVLKRFYETSLPTSLESHIDNSAYWMPSNARRKDYIFPEGKRTPADLSHLIPTEALY